jgi:hypothetical protein
MILMAWHSSSTLGFFIAQTGVRTWAIWNTTVLNDLQKAYSLECVAVIIPPDMTTRSVFTAWIRDLTSSVKWPLNVSSKSFPSLINNTLGLLFHTTCNQSTSIYFSHLIVWYLIIIISPIDTCAFGIAVFYSAVVMCTVCQLSTLQSLSSFHYLMFMTTDSSFTLLGVTGWCIKVHSVLDLNFCHWLSLMMLHETGIPFCLCMCTKNNIHVELA